MLVGLLSGKVERYLTRPACGIEDLLTATVLGSCCYVPAHGALLPFLGHTVLPFPGHTVNTDEGTAGSPCWLSRHFVPVELAQFEDLAAAEHLVVTEEHLLANLGEADRQTVLGQARLQNQLEKHLQEILADVYKNHGQISAMAKDIGERRSRRGARETET